MSHTFNFALEYQSQNHGTQLGAEYMYRKMARRYDTIKVWGSQGVITDGKISANLPAIYWKVTIYNGEIHCYWMPNNERVQDKLITRNLR